MKKKIVILLAGSAGICLGVGGCINDLLFLVAPLLT